MTGPTGSGKSTTLYSALLEIKSDETKIITTEDPVEYQLEGINQIQVHPKIGLTFGNSLRSILRHDPDMILVGEIRDLETAENAIQASLTGHLVFSTLHTNDAAGAYTRLVDMGVEPFLVSSTVEAVMAQRLVRTLCPHCKQPYRAARPTTCPSISRAKASGRECRCIGRSAAASAARWATAAASDSTSCWSPPRKSANCRTSASAVGPSRRRPFARECTACARTAGRRFSPDAPRSTKCCA